MHRLSLILLGLLTLATVSQVRTEYIWTGTEWKWQEPLDSLGLNGNQTNGTSFSPASDDESFVNEYFEEDDEYDYDEYYEYGSVGFVDIFVAPGNHSAFNNNNTKDDDEELFSFNYKTYYDNEDDRCYFVSELWIYLRLKEKEYQRYEQK